MKKCVITQDRFALFICKLILMPYDVKMEDHDIVCMHVIEV